MSNPQNKLGTALANQPPIKPTSTALPPVKPESDPFLIGTYAGRINKAIVAIGQNLKTQWRTDLDAYLRHVSPRLADNGDSALPHSLRPHARSTPAAPRSTNPTLYGNISFLVGSTIVAFYGAVNGAKPDVLLSLLTRIEEIATLGPANFAADGDERKGWTLITKAATAAKKAQQD